MSFGCGTYFNSFLVKFGPRLHIFEPYSVKKVGLSYHQKVPTYVSLRSSRHGLKLFAIHFVEISNFKRQTLLGLNSVAC